MLERWIESREWSKGFVVISVFALSLMLIFSSVTVYVPMTEKGIKWGQEITAKAAGEAQAIWAKVNVFLSGEGE